MLVPRHYYGLLIFSFSFFSVLWKNVSNNGFLVVQCILLTFQHSLEQPRAPAYYFQVCWRYFWSELRATSIDNTEIFRPNFILQSPLWPPHHCRNGLHTLEQTNPSSEVRRCYVSSSPIDVLTRTNNVLKHLSIYMINCGTLNLWVRSVIVIGFYADGRAVSP
jgi:hypothetical protein